MIKNLRFSQIILRISLASVFFWFGIDKFFHPNYWLTAWMPQSLISAAELIGLSGRDIITVSGIFEILVGVSLVTTIYLRIFAAVASGFLFSVFLIFSFGNFSEILVRDIGLIGGLLALAFWPRRSF